MEVFVWKSAICLAIFYSIYKLILEKENIHHFKRFFLLGSVLLSISIPLITFTNYVEVMSQPAVTSISVPDNGAYLTAAPSFNYAPFILWSVYLIGVLYFGFRLIRNIRHMVLQIRQNPHHKNHHIIHVLLGKLVVPHTFLQYVFLNKKAYEAQLIPQAVLDHEAAHAKQYHTLDLLFVELIKVVFWFNPFVHLLQGCIKLNHEFLADRAVLQNGTSATAYQELILAYSSHAMQPALATPIHYSSFKKRFTVMKRNTSRSRKFLLGAFILPMVAVMVFGFSETQTVYQKADSPTKATPEQIAQYNTMANFWNQRFEETHPERAMPLSELGTLEKLYNIMSEDQKAEASPFPVCTPVGKIITLWIHGYNIKLNNETVSLAEFSNALDRITSNWIAADFENSGIHIQISDVKDNFMKKLETEYQKTRLFKMKKNKLIPPPPPAPEAPVSATVPGNSGSAAPSTPPPAPEAPQPTNGLPKMGVMLLNLPQVGPVPDLNNPRELIAYIDGLGVPFYNDMKKITKEEALEIALTHQLEITHVPHTDDGQPMMMFTTGC